MANSAGMGGVLFNGVRDVLVRAGLFGQKPKSAIVSVQSCGNIYPLIVMTLTQIEQRVKVLERTVAHLAKAKPLANDKWYRTHAGRFAGDPVFDHIVELGRAYRKSQRPPRHPRQS